MVGAHGKEKKLAQLFVRLHVGHETRSCFVKRVLHRVPSDQREVKVSHKVNGCRVQHLRGINNSEVPRAVQGGGASRAREEESIVHQTNELKEGMGGGERERGDRGGRTRGINVATEGRCVVEGFVCQAAATCTAILRRGRVLNGG